MIIDFIFLSAIILIPITIYWNWKDGKENKKEIEKEDRIRKNAKKKEGN